MIIKRIMAGKKSIIMSGAAYSFLMYEIGRNNQTQEGFLLGEINENKIETITDNDRLSITVDRTIKIHTVLPCPYANYFYNGIGIINKEKLRSLLDDKVTSVVGWYRYRNMKDVKFTLRDNLVHKQLMHFFTPPTELFIYSLISLDNSNTSTHVFKQTFLQYDNVEFKPIIFNILNLSNSTFSYKIPEKQSRIFNKIINSIKTNTVNGLCTIEDINQSLQLHIEELVKELANEESKMFNLEQEVKRLQEQLRIKKSINQEIKFEDNCLINGQVMNTSNLQVNDLETVKEQIVQNDEIVEKKSYSDMLKQVKK